MSEPTDAQMEGYEFRRAGGAAPTASQWDGMAADEWDSRDSDGYRRRPHLGELHQIQQLRAENTRLLARLRLAEDCASLFRDHLHGCVDTVREMDALTEWEYAAGVKPVPDTADDYPRAEDMA